MHRQLPGLRIMTKATTASKATPAPTAISVFRQSVLEGVGAIEDCGLRIAD